MSQKQITEVNPTSWVSSNRVGFLPWVYKTFSRTKYGEEDPAATVECVGEQGTEQCEAVPKSKNQRFFPHQRIVRDLIQIDSPYRGILLFHSLGTGKTATSIASAEGFTAKHRKVHVMVPASLQQNYREEIRRYANVGKGFKGTWVQVRIDPSSQNETEKTAYRTLQRMHRLGTDHYKTTSGKAWVPYVPEDFPKEYIVGKTPYKELSSTDKAKVEKTIEKIIDTRYNFINYNGLTLDAVNRMSEKDFDRSLVVIDEAHNFIRLIVNNSTIARKLYGYITEARDVKIVLLSGTPIINHPYELGVMLNLLRGPMITYELSILKGSALPNTEEIEEKLRKGGVWKHIDDVRLSSDRTSILINLISPYYVRAEQNGVTRLQRTPAATLTAEIDDTILEKVRKALQPAIKLGKRAKETISSAFPQKKEDFDNLFLDTTDPKNPMIKNTDLFLRRSIGLVSYVRTAGEELFPQINERVIKPIPLTNDSFKIYAEVRDTEIKMDEKRVKKQIARHHGATNIMDQQDPVVYRAFSRMACNFTFPRAIKREFPGDIKRALKREISAADDVDIEEQVEEEVGKIDISKKAKKDYEVHKREIMEALQKNAGLYLTHQKLRTKYSSKMASIIDDIQSSPGKSLVYSQFREIEGIGILRTALLAEGWIEVDIERHGSNYVIQDAKKVLSSAYTGKRFVVFSDDRVKTAMLLNLYNGNFDRLPESLQEQVKGMTYKNLRGELINVLMITASATEGISLKNVRRVLIMEPFWNMVRMDQVIGRAVRAGSHLELPEPERKVDVYVYVATLTEEQLKNDFTLRTKDNSLSSDESILSVAERKNHIISQFLTMMKSAAIDCLVHSHKNKPLENKFQCYSFPINMDDDNFAYIPNIVADENPREMRNVRDKIIKAKAVMVGKKKYVTFGEPAKLYDYVAYKEAGVLIPADV